MDLPHPHFARIERPDDVRQWALLEGKSDTMSDDLCRQFAESQAPITAKQSRIALVTELVTATINAWWHIGSR